MYQILDLIIELLKGKSTRLTRMHSRRMRTVRFSGCLYRGLSASGSRGVSTSGSEGGVYHTPPFTTDTSFHLTLYGQTNTREKITLPQISFPGGNNNFGFTSLIYLPWSNSNSMNSIYFPNDLFGLKMPIKPFDTLQLQFNLINSSWC